MSTGVLGMGTAHAAYSECNSSPQRLCLWDGSNGTGAKYEYGGDWSGCVNVVSTWNDRISSAYNRMSIPVTLYQHANCSGGISYFRQGISGNVGGGIGNKVTSIWFGY
ncbi:peptidase inhibitor family I36 protein [Sphaerisporangium rufum]|uniref:peptidase inhibitor family I36 protein n=1 Tax=Sphaerisporangium rufum TaxID=1381558 RepID=UPI0019518240|nr:peptidase inhibitor family I36 protein [Sphaerisporangium rufum]